MNKPNVPNATVPDESLIHPYAYMASITATCENGHYVKGEEQNVDTFSLQCTASDTWSPLKANAACVPKGNIFRLLSVCVRIKFNPDVRIKIEAQLYHA